MNTPPDNTRAILKTLPDRPNHVPSGFEFLPDAFKRDVEPHGSEAVELVRRALAEGDIVAYLKSHLGHLQPIDQRMWDKWPLARKVYPRFRDGKMRMGLHDFEGPYLVGWICVRKGDLRKACEGSLPTNKKSTQTPQFSRHKLEQRYKAHVKAVLAAGKRSSREQDREAMSEALGITIPHREIRRVRKEFLPKDWQSPGRPRRKSGQK